MNRILLFSATAILTFFTGLVSYSQCPPNPCDDGNPETCDISYVDSIDNVRKCLHIYDRGCNSEPITWYKDTDGDGYFSKSIVCLYPPGFDWTDRFRFGGGDCEDDRLLNLDASLLNPETKWYLDKDGDGYYTGDFIKACIDLGPDYKYKNLLGIDCDDDDPQINSPGSNGSCNQAELIGLEVTQVIQDWNNTIPLIEHKRTFVLAHIMSKDDKSKEVNVKLLVKDINGNLLGPPLSATNASLFEALPKALNTDEIVLYRTLGASCLKFELDDKWTVGTIFLELEDGIDCKESAGTPNDCKVSATFYPSKLMSMEFYNTDWTELTDLFLTNHSIPDDEFEKVIIKQEKDILAQFPVSKILKTYEKYEYPISPFPPLSFPDIAFGLNNISFKILKLLNNSKENEIYLSIIDGPEGATAGLASWIPGEIATIHKKHIGSTPHELGHLHGRQHFTYCGAVAYPPPNEILKDHELYFPEEEEEKNRIKPSISPHNSINANENLANLMFGWMTNRDYPIPANPNIVFDLMSYCRPRWVSDITYKALNTAINLGERYPDAKATPFQGRSMLRENKTDEIAQQAGFHRLFSGLIDLDNYQTELTPAIYMSSDNNKLPFPGEYKLQLIDKDNNIAETIDFKPTALFKESELTPNEAHFLIPVSIEQPLKKAIVFKNNEVIGEKSAGINIPTVRVLYPNGGEVFNSRSMFIKWEGFDIDGDKLTYCIQYSKDGGNSWKTLAINLENSFYETDLNYIEGTNDGMIRLLVSDGLNVAKDESDNSFFTPNNKPKAYIVTPSDAAIFIGEEPVFFRGNAFDKENGDITASSLTWTSSLDGFLGNEETFYKPANELSEGVHIITFTATDNDGASTSKTVKIRILRSYAFSLDCPSDITEYTSSGKCDVNLEFAVQTRSKTDVTIVYKIGGSTITFPYNFPVGTADVLVTALNGVDPELSCSFKVTVMDKERPRLRCPSVPLICYNSTGRYVIPPLEASDNCGIQSYAYTITGATIRSGNSADASGPLNPGTSILEWTVTDVNGNVNSCQQTIIVNPPIMISIPDAKAMNQGVAQNTVYIGYNPASTITIKAEASGGSGNLSYKWSNGATTSSIIINPSVTTAYTFTITDESGCTNTAIKQISVVDARCGNKNDKVLVCHNASAKGHTICISSNDVAAHLTEHGDYLGTCATIVTTSVNKPSQVKEAITQFEKAKFFPNPANQFVNLKLSNELAYGKINIQLIDRNGRMVKKSEQMNIQKGQIIKLNTAGFTDGLYLVVISDRNGNQLLHKVIIQH